MSAKILGQEVGRVGYGLMGLTLPPFPSDEVCFAAMRAALDQGSNLWDGGEFYGPPHANSLALLKRYYEKYPEDAGRVVLNIKGAIRPGFVTDGSPEFVRQSVEKCVEQLGGVGKIDMFECGRRDPNTPLEVTLSTLEELVKQGKIGGVALTEVNAKTIREAAKITKVVAVEIEISLFCTDALHNGITDACAELDIPIIAYSPIGKGMLSGKIKSFEDIPEKDFRRMLPRFQPANFETNLKLVDRVVDLARKKGCTPAQLALAWVCSLSERKGMPKVIPIPGASNVDRVVENGKSKDVKLDAGELADIDKILAECEVAGERYHPHGMKMVNG